MRFYFVKARKLRETDRERLPALQTLLDDPDTQDWIQSIDIDFASACAGKYARQYLAISHCWLKPDNPDPEGHQFKAVKEHVRANPEIKYVWVDWLCMWQEKPGHRPVRMHEKDEFRDMLSEVNMLYLGCRVLILVDLSYISRFWTMYEAWLATQQCTSKGLAAVPEGGNVRWSAVGIVGVQSDTIIKGVMEQVRSKGTPEEAAAWLRGDDIKVTNQSDKDKQLEKVAGLSVRVKESFGAFVKESSGASKTLGRRRKVSPGTSEQVQAPGGARPTAQQRYQLLRRAVPMIGLFAKARGVAATPLVRQKLRNKDAPLSAGESIQCIVDCVRYGLSQAQCADGKDLVVVLGNTGAGKSTFVNFLHGCQMERRNKMLRVAEGSSPPEIMPIGHTKESMTFAPSVKPATEGGLGPSFAYADCPGFLDNRGFEINVANGANVRQMLKRTASARVVVLISYMSIRADRGRGLIDLCSILLQLFGGVEQLVRHAGSLLIGVSQAPTTDPDDEEEPNTLDAICTLLLDPAGLSDEQQAILAALREQIFVFHPLEAKGRGDPSWHKRADILRRIEHLTPITAPGAVFQTALVPEDMVGFNAVVDEVATQITEEVTRSERYEEAARMLAHLRELQCLESEQLAPVLARAAESVRKHVQQLEGSTDARVAQGELMLANDVCDRLLRAQAAFRNEGEEALADEILDSSRRARARIAVREKQKAELAAKQAEAERATAEAKRATAEKAEMEAKRKQEETLRKEQEARLEEQQRLAREQQRRLDDLQAQRRREEQRDERARDRQRAEQRAREQRPPPPPQRQKSLPLHEKMGKGIHTFFTKGELFNHNLRGERVQSRF